jgi:hypothetical protein
VNPVIFGRRLGLLLAKVPRPLLKFPELPVHNKRESHPDDAHGKTRPGTYIRPRSGVLGCGPGKADDTADHESECGRKGRRALAHGRTTLPR